MTSEEFLDKERALAKENNPDLVHFYHTTIMQIFKEQEEEKEKAKEEGRVEVLRNLGIQNIEKPNEWGF